LYPQKGLKKLLEERCPGRVRQRVALAPYTTLGIGGQADWFIEPQGLSELQSLVRLLKDRDIPWYLLGQGSNLLVADRGVRGVVIHLGRVWSAIEARDLEENHLVLEAGAGLTLPGLVHYGVKHRLSGLEFLAGIPGSLGGAWAMNAGSYGREISHITAHLRVCTPQGEIKKIGREDLAFHYRGLELTPGTIILGGGLLLARAEAKAVRKETRDLWSRRRKTQPLGLPSCGSVFKNPAGDFAGRLIEEAGLKGFEKGGLEVSQVHANFIVNRSQGKARDFLRLMRLIRKRVFQHTGILLEPEVICWGCSL
jgi:UDP-N-acetylmuramate dehydrogenase